MTFINYASREINCKIVYYGPGLCGKTTNLQYIYEKTNPNAKGKLISLATETDRTLFFDFLPLELGTVRGFKTRFHLYTVPGQVFYDASRKLILKGVDGVIFVADSQVERMDANAEAIDNLVANLKAQGYDLMTIPYVLQLNKRDLPNVAPKVEMVKALNRKGEPVVEAVAVDEMLEQQQRVAPEDAIDELPEGAGAGLLAGTRRRINVGTALGTVPDPVRLLELLQNRQHRRVRRLLLAAQRRADLLDGRLALGPQHFHHCLLQAAEFVEASWGHSWVTGLGGGAN